MTLKKPTKIEFEEFKKSYTPFYVDHDYEEVIDKEILTNVNSLLNKMTNVSEIEGLKKYIEEDVDSLNNILSLLGFSSEKFFRIVSMIRVQRGESFNTEWKLETIRKNMLKDKTFFNLICNLFLNGSSIGFFKDNIPKFYLDNLVLDTVSLSQLTDENRLKRLVKQKRDGKYNNDVGDKIEDQIEKYLIELREKYGVGYEREKTVDWIARNMDFCIPSRVDPYVIIEVSYQITTSSAQTTKREVEVKTSEEIRRHNIQKGKDVAFVNFIEGAGWLGRQADMRRLYDCSDYVLNLKNLSELESIIIKHVPDKYFSISKPLLV